MTTLDSFQGLLLQPAHKAKYLSASDALGKINYNLHKCIDQPDKTWLNTQMRTSQVASLTSKSKEEKKNVNEFYTSCFTISNYKIHFQKT